MTGQRWQVRCDEYTSPPYKDRAAAEQVLEAIEILGACSGPHEIIETGGTAI
jgi:hypothetical protein